MDNHSDSPKSCYTLKKQYQHPFLKNAYLVKKNYKLTVLAPYLVIKYVIPDIKKQAVLCHCLHGMFCIKIACQSRKKTFSVHKTYI